MKFSNGFWLPKEGMSVYSPTKAYRTKNCGDSLAVLAPCVTVKGRGDTLQGPTLTLSVSSPMPDVVRVKITHFAGAADRGPHFEVAADPDANPVVEEDEKEIRLTTGGLAARISKTDWSLGFYRGGEKITESGLRHCAYIESRSGETFLREQLDLDVGECVYGLGERFTPFVKNGQAVDIWNKDGGTCSEQAYKNIPFYVTSRGYGVFVRHTEGVSFEVASEVVSRVQFSVPGETLEYYFINGPELKDVLARYTALTGRPALPPAWSFGLWLSTSFTTDYDEQTVTRFVDGMAERKIPLQVFHFDCFWMREYNWCDFTWDARVFPDPEGMLRRLKAKGLHICVWINPYIAQASPLFAEGVEKGYLLHREDGSVWQWDLWQPGMGIVDFTNPAACEWYAGHIRRLASMGVDCFKTDFGERIPVRDVVYHDGSDPVKMHNYYTFLYNRTVFEAIRSVRGKGDAVVFARSATAGSQQFPVHWGGDCTASYASMAETLRGGLSLGLSGFGFWSHDIGGFESTASPDVYKRWVAFGLLSSHSRLHGSSSYRVPWLFDDEAVDVLRFFTRLKCRLMPYLFAVAAEASRRGVPVLRAMVLEFQKDPACAFLDRQYMLGGSLLVAPVFSEKGEVEYYLPEGKWVSLLTGEALEGGRYRREKHGFLSLPLLVRPGTVLPLGQTDDRADYDYADHVTLLVWLPEDGMTAEATVYDTKARPVLKADASRRDGRVEIHVAPLSGERKPWEVLLPGVRALAGAQGARWRSGETGVILTPEQDGETVAAVL
jgi:alpha-D-xyloside xylohydrolase